MSPISISILGPGRSGSINIYFNGSIDDGFERGMLDLAGRMKYPVFKVERRCLTSSFT